MTRPDLARHRARIERELETLLRRTSKVERDLLREGDAPTRDWDDQAVELENEEVLEGLHEEGRAQIAQLRAALRRLDEGTWGRCQRCGAEIAAARLEALPAATTCIACARRAEGEPG